MEDSFTRESSRESFIGESAKEPATIESASTSIESFTNHHFPKESLTRDLKEPSTKESSTLTTTTTPTTTDYNLPPAFYSRGYVVLQPLSVDIHGHVVVLEVKNSVGRRMVCKISKNEELYQREVTILKELNEMNDYVVTLLDSMPNILLLEMGEVMTVEYLENDGHYVKSIQEQAARAMQMLHSRGYVHLDFKYSQLVNFSKFGSKWKLIDFDQAVNIKKPIKVNKNILTTPMFAAPELLWALAAKEEGNTMIDFAMDVWSFGCFLYWCMTKKNVFENDEMALKVILALDLDNYCLVQMFPEKFVFQNNKALDLFKRIFTVPSKRLSMHDLVNHSFFGSAGRYTQELNSLLQSQNIVLTTMQNNQAVILNEFNKLENSLRRAVDDLLRAGDLSQKTMFPATCLMVPESDKNRKWTDFKMYYTNQRRIHLLCEFNCSSGTKLSLGELQKLPNGPLWHRTVHEGFLIENMKDDFKDLLAIAKCVSFVLDTGAKMAKVLGFDVTEITSLFRQSVENVDQALHKSLVELDSAKANIEATLSGDNLKLLKSAIMKICSMKDEAVGDLQVGFVGLDRCQVRRDNCPLGSRGSVCFLCPEHANLVNDWNNYSIASAEEFFTIGARISELAFRRVKDEVNQLKLDNLKTFSFQDSPQLEQKTDKIEPVSSLPASLHGNDQDAYTLGLNYYNGWSGFAKDFNKAAPLFEKAVATGNIYAHYALGVCYLSGQGVVKNRVKAKELLDIAARGGVELAVKMLQQHFHTSSPNDNVLNDIKRIEELAKSAHSFYFGANKDYGKAFELAQQCCSAGDSFLGKYVLGCCYYNGKGVSKDHSKAFNCFVYCSAQGYTHGSFSLGCCYYFGTGVVQDKAKAKEIWEKLAKEGYQNAKAKLQEYFKM